MKADPLEPLATRDWQHPGLQMYRDVALLNDQATLADVVAQCRGVLCYLATPFTKIAQYDDGEFDPAKSLECATRAARWSRALAIEGVTAVSPVIQSVEMVHADFVDQQLDPLDWDFWMCWCQPLLHACPVVIVPRIDGWGDSDGVWHDAVTALRQQKRVFVLRPDAGLGRDGWHARADGRAGWHARADAVEG